MDLKEKEQENASTDSKSIPRTHFLLQNYYFSFKTVKGRAGPSSTANF